MNVLRQKAAQKVPPFPERRTAHVRRGSRLAFVFKLKRFRLFICFYYNMISTANGGCGGKTAVGAYAPNH